MVGDARQRSRAWYGTALIVLLIGLAVVIFFLNDIIAAFDRRYTIVVVMPRAPGLTDGSPVWIGGRAVGSITTIGFMPTGPDTAAHLAITLDLPRAVQRQVRADSRVRLTSARLIGQPVLDIVPGSRSAPVLRPGDTILVAHSLSFAELTARAGVVRAELDSTLQLLRPLAAPLRARMAQTRRAFAALDAALADARRLQRDVGASPTFTLLRDPAFAASLDRSRAQATELSRALSAFRARAAADSEMRGAVARLQLRADTIRAQLDATAALLESGFFGRAQRDSALTRAVHAARAELDSLIADTRRNPLRYFFK